ncbi:MAG: 1-(5-phosphoribosyl)-5-[(5-phosphoribosylamino)methylideneamino]imidazole-4-carboxamide isomerase [Woeseia sp.]
MMVVPAIDLRGGSCVRLLKGDFSKETHYSDDPIKVASGYRKMGLSHLHVVDLDGALTGEQQHQALVERITGATGLTVQLGGGIRDSRAVARWLQSGVSRCVIGSMAITQAEKTAGWLREFGPDKIVLALDVRLDANATPILATHGWTRGSNLTLWQCIDRYGHAGLKHVLCTDIAADGALTGPNVDLYQEFLTRCPGIELQASGGVRDIADLEALRSIGCAAAITGRAMLDGRITQEEILSFLQDA